MRNRNRRHRLFLSTVFLLLGFTTTPALAQFDFVNTQSSLSGTGYTVRDSNGTLIDGGSSTPDETSIYESGSFGTFDYQSSLGGTGYTLRSPNGILIAGGSSTPDGTSSYGVVPAGFSVGGYRHCRHRRQRHYDH